MRTQFNILILICLFLVISSDVFAFRNRGKSWNRFTVNYPFKTAPKLKLRFFAEPRFHNDLKDYDQILLGPSLQYKFNSNWNAILGYEYRGIYRNSQVRGENRFWQALNYGHNLNGFLRLFFRLRFDNMSFVNFEDVGLRIRPLVGLRFQLSKNNKWSAFLSQEYYYFSHNTDWGARKGFDQNRAIAGVEYKFHKNFKFMLGYMNQYVNKQSPTTDEMNHTLLTNLTLILK